MDINTIDKLMKKAYKTDKIPPEMLNDRIISKTSAVQKADYRPRRLAIALASLCLLTAVFATAQSETAARIYDSFIEWCDDVFSIDTGVVESKFSQTRLLGEYEMTVNRIIFSEHELFIAYTINADITKDDMLWLTLKYGNRVISDSKGADNLFSGCIANLSQNSSMRLDGWNRAENGVYEGYAVWRGVGLNYENQAISLECSYYNKDKETIVSCTFDIPLISEYKYSEQTAPLDFEYEENGDIYRYHSIVNTYSGLLVIGTGADVPRDVRCIITDEKGQEVQCLSAAGYGSDEFVLFYRRNSIGHGQSYTVAFSGHGDLYKTMISFE